MARPRKYKQPIFQKRYDNYLCIRCSSGDLAMKSNGELAVHCTECLDALRLKRALETERHAQG